MAILADKKKSQLCRSAGSCSGCTELEGVLCLGGNGWKPEMLPLDCHRTVSREVQEPK